MTFKTLMAAIAADRISNWERVRNYTPEVANV